MKKIKTALTSLSLAVMALLPRKVLAAAPPRLEEIGGIVDSVSELILPIGGLISLIMIVYGGYMWMLSSGDPGKLKQAQGTLTWAIVGLVFLFLFRAILKGVLDFIGN
ncbi:hypothetical protein HYV12_01585 [Candidatus Dojkabacteria bacterium]|nr:hypothetical protein [Candidatus Dojkabacteria bacterium]